MICLQKDTKQWCDAAQLHSSRSCRQRTIKLNDQNRVFTSTKFLLLIPIPTLHFQYRLMKVLIRYCRYYSLYTTANHANVKGGASSIAVFGNCIMMITWPARRGIISIFKWNLVGRTMQFLDFQPLVNVSSTQYTESLKRLRYQIQIWYLPWNVLACAAFSISER